MGHKIMGDREKMDRDNIFCPYHNARIRGHPMKLLSAVDNHNNPKGMELYVVHN